MDPGRLPYPDMSYRSTSYSLVGCPDLWLFIDPLDQGQWGKWITLKVFYFNASLIMLQKSKVWNYYSGAETFQYNLTEQFSRIMNYSYF